MKVLLRTENVLSRRKSPSSHTVGPSQYLGLVNYLGINLDSFMAVRFKGRVAGTSSSFMHGDCERTRGYMTLGSERHIASTEARSSSVINF